MALPIKTAQTEHVINVSQDYRTPSSTTSNAIIRTFRPYEIVEDSLKQKQGAEAGVLYETQETPRSDSDDLYGLSPQAQRDYDERRLTAVGALKTQETPRSDSGNLYGLSTPAQKDYDERRLTAAGALKLLDGEGEDSRGNFASGKGSAGNLPRSSMQDSILVEDSLGARDPLAGNLKESIVHPATMKPSKKDARSAGLAHQTAASKDDHAPAPKQGNRKEASKLATGTAGSSVAALRQRKAVAIESVAESTTNRKSLPIASKDTRAPAEPDSVFRSEEAALIETANDDGPARKQTTTTGKLTSRNSAAHNQDPPASRSAKTAQQALSKPNAKRATKETAGPAKGQSKNDKPVQGSLRHPAKKTQGKGEDDVSAYNVPLSPRDDIREPMASTTKPPQPRRGRPPKNAKDSKAAPGRKSGAGAVAATSKPKAIEKKPAKATAKPLSTKAKMMSTKESKEVRKSNVTEKDKDDAEYVPAGQPPLEAPGRVTRQSLGKDVTKTARSAADAASLSPSGAEHDRPIPPDTGNSRITDQAMPAIPTSSPPAAQASISHRPEQTPINIYASRKSNIISWDKNGPRNQGGASPKKTLLDSVKTTRTPALPPAQQFPSEWSGLLTHENLLHSSKVNTRPAQGGRKSALSEVAPNVEDALASFMGKSSKATDNPQQPPAVALESSPASHAPDIVDLSDDNGFQHIEDLDGPTLIADDEERSRSAETEKLRKGSSFAMPPPQSGNALFSNLLAKKTLQLPPASDLAATSSRPSVNSNGKRPAQSVSIDDRGKKRMRDSGTQVSQGMGKSNADQQHSVREKLAASRVSNEESSSGAVPPARKPSRVASQGTVDKLGSPVPRGMVVDDECTVLETFSQRARAEMDVDDENSEMIGDVIPNARPERHLADGPTLPDHETSDSGVSETRQHPIFNVARKSLDGRETAARSAPQNPELPTREAGPEEVQKEGSSSSFKQHLDEIARKIQQQQQVLRREHGREQSDATRNETNKQTSSRKRKRIPSYTTISTDSSPAESSSTTSIMRNIMLWRSALQPHQLHLFDELVQISHSLIQHLVDQETAASEVVDDYLRRGNALVEKMESTHAKMLADEVKKLEQQKRRLRKDLIACNSRLGGLVKDVTAAQKEWKERGLESEGVEKALQEVMEEFC